jgi:predicted nuclease of restriction endonuclease-like (RecB) superfamily
MVELHKQINDMLYRGVFQSSASEKKMREMAINIEKKLKQERVAMKAKQIQIVELEKNIISLGENPQNPKVVGDLMSQKDNEIKVLKKNKYPRSTTCTNS